MENANLVALDGPFNLRNLHRYLVPADRFADVHVTAGNSEVQPEHFVAAIGIDDKQ